MAVTERVLYRESRRGSEPSGSPQRIQKSWAVTTTESVASREPKEPLTSPPLDSFAPLTCDRPQTHRTLGKTLCLKEQSATA